MRPARPFRSLRVLLLVISIVAAGCRESDDDGAARIEAAQLIVGSTAVEWGLLAIPRGGGPATLRLIARPDSVVWTGSEEIAVLLGAWPLGEDRAVFLAEDSTVFRYDPAAGQLDELQSLRNGGLSSLSPAGAVFLDSAGYRIRLVESERSVDVDLEEPAVWAGAMKGGLAALVGPSPHALRRIDTGGSDETSGSSLEAAGRPPALVTAWGERVVVTTPDGRGIRVYSFEDGWSLTGEVEFGDSVTAVSASPSSHEIYVGLASPPRVERVSRFSFQARRLAETSEDPVAIRPNLFGDALLVRTTGGIERISSSGERVERLPGQWREDLPLGLPAGITLLASEDETHRVSELDTIHVVLDDGAPIWWVPVRWNPARADTPPLVEALVGEDSVDTAGEEGGTSDGGVGDTDDLEVPLVGAESDERTEGPPGYYAIVTSARQRAGVEALLSTLEAAGYPARIQTYPDEAGEVWYRGLVGPFSTRARAQAAARQLLRERDLQAWVTEIGVSR